MATEKEDLDQFVQTQGWLRFCQFAEKEWSDQFAEHVRLAVADTDNLAALAKLRQVTVARDAIQRLLKWPKERLAEIDRTEQMHIVDPLSRRGRL